MGKAAYFGQKMGIKKEIGEVGKIGDQTPLPMKELEKEKVEQLRDGASKLCRDIYAFSSRENDDYRGLKRNDGRVLGQGEELAMERTIFKARAELHFTLLSAHGTYRCPMTLPLLGIFHYFLTNEPRFQLISEAVVSELRIQRRLEIHPFH